MSESNPTPDQLQPAGERERLIVDLQRELAYYFGQAHGSFGHKLDALQCKENNCEYIKNLLHASILPATPAPVPVEQRCVEPMLSIPAQWIINHYDRVKHLDYACEECCRDRDDSTVVNGFICIYHQAKAALRVFTPSANSEVLMHEDELPPDIPKEDYDKWYAQSRVIDSIGCRIGPRYPFAAPSPESEVSDAGLAALADRINNNVARMEESQKVSQAELTNIEFSTPPSTGTEELLPCPLDHPIARSIGCVEAMLGWTIYCRDCGLTRTGFESKEHAVKAWQDRRTTPSPSGDAEKVTRQAFEDIAHLARERVNVPASEVYALLEHIDRRVSAALAALTSRRELTDYKGDRK